MRSLLLVGNPNSGKTTFFNSLTGANEHVGNWHGVTTICKEKQAEFAGEMWSIVDTPGIYSLNPFSFEEEEAINALENEKNAKIVNLCDRDNLQKNLYLTLCLLEEGFDVAIAVNCTKKRPCFVVDTKKLEEKLGVLTASFDASKKSDVGFIEKFSKLDKCFPLLPYFDDNFSNLSFEEKARKRYEYIDIILSECTLKTGKVYGKNKFDRVALNKFLAIPLFFAVILAVFYLTFFVFGNIFSQIFDFVLDFFSKPILHFLENKIGKSWIYDIFNVAILGGIKTILNFLPQIVLLFLFLTILEESGYLSRVAFVFDDVLSKVGLSGKAVYSLLMGFGCSTTAIMTAKLADEKNAKIKTAILCPYMSCSAKIPIYMVIGGAFFGSKSIFVVFSMYLLGVVVSILLSTILDKTILKSNKQTFILEFPPYRKISFKKTCASLIENAKQFLGKVGSILLCMNIVVFVLSSFTFSFEYVRMGSGDSILEKIAGVFSFIFLPLGFGSKAICAVLLSGFVAKEVVVSSIAMFNGIDAFSNSLISLSLLDKTNPIFFASYASVISFLSYCLLYTPCLSSVLMLKKEVGKKWTAFAIVLQLFVSYMVAFVLYNIIFAFEVFGFWKVFLSVMALFVFSFCVVFIARAIKSKRVCAFCNGCDKNCNKRR